MARAELSCWRDRRVLVTGHSGFVGSWLSAALTRAGALVIGFSLDTDRHTTTRRRWLADLGVEPVVGDIRDAAAVDDAVRRSRPHAVFHLAGQPLVGVGLTDPHTTLTTNILGSVNVLDAVRRHRPAVVVHVTSDKCYRNREWPWAYRENDELGGGCPYSVSKAAAELVFEGYAANYGGPGAPAMASVRFSNVIGGGDFGAGRLVPDCAAALAAGTPVRLRMPDAVRPWQHVLDVVDGVAVLSERLRTGRVASGAVYNLTPVLPAELTVAELTRRFAEYWHPGGPAPAPEVDAAALSGEHRLLHLDGRKAATELGWRHTVDIAEALRRTAAWYREHAAGADPGRLTIAQLDDHFALADPAPREVVSR